MARNSVLSFRNNTRHNYLLRCLLTCKTCGLAMFGITYPAADGQLPHRYYKCHGKDCVARDRERPCPQSRAQVDELDAAVWGHVKGLLNDPATLLEQFEACARQADIEQTNDSAEQKKWQGQLRRLDREEQRLLDAYQAEIIELEELKARRQQIALRRQTLAAQREQQTRLLAERQAAREVWADLKAFCDRIRGRLEDATLAEKQQLLQLLIERVIVGEDTLEIRHVIPLRRQKSPASGPASPDDPSGGSVPTGSRPEAGDERLRSDGVSPTNLAATRREVVIDRIAVGRQDPRLAADQLGQHLPPSGEADQEHRHAGGHGHPQPSPLPALPPPGLVYIGRLPDHMGVGLAGNRLQGGGCHALKVANRSRADWDTEQVSAQTGDASLAYPVGPGKYGAHCLHPRAVAATDLGRKRRARNPAAPRAGQPVAAKLGDVRANRRDLDHLMP